MIEHISRVVTEKNIIIISPHYDDVPLIFEDLLNMLGKNQLIHEKKIRIIQIFSISNYQNCDDAGNRDLSPKRV
jgi:hypothetical protein